MRGSKDFDWLADVTLAPTSAGPIPPPPLPESNLRLSDIKGHWRQSAPPPKPRAPTPKKPRGAPRLSAPDSLYLYVEDIAHIIHVSTKTVRRWIHSSALPARKLGHTGQSRAPWRISRLDWEAFQAGQTRRELSLDDVYGAWDRGGDEPDRRR